jgi:Ca2+-binding RTX toxin-like protein
MALRFGGWQDDLLVGTAGSDILFDLAGEDSLFGLGGGDLMFGGSGDDLLEGDAPPPAALITGPVGDPGADTLFGGGGDDTVSGGGGADLLFGGAGADVFRFHAPDDAGSGAGVIADFSRAEGDRIDLTTIGDTDPSAPGEQGFHFVGDVTGLARPAVYVPGEITFVQGGGVTSVTVNTGGGVLTIRLAGLVDLAAADFAF